MSAYLLRIALLRAGYTPVPCRAGKPVVIPHGPVAESAIPSVKSRPRGCARKSLARKLQAAEKPVFFNGDSSGSARKPHETSISSREAQRAAPPADGSGTMCHR